MHTIHHTFAMHTKRESGEKIDKSTRTPIFTILIEFLGRVAGKKEFFHVFVFRVTSVIFIGFIVLVTHHPYRNDSKLP